MCQALLSHWAESPGTMLVGLGNSAALDPDVVGYYPHDVPIETLGEEGVLGLAIYLGINGLALSGLLKGLRATKHDPRLRGLLAVAGANYLFTLMTTLKEGNMVGSAEFFLAAILLARMPEMLSAKSSPVEAPAEEVPARAIPRFANMMR